MSQSISLYAARASGLHDLHPFTKLTLAGTILLLGLLTPGTLGPYLPVLLLILPAAIWGRILGSLANSLWRIVLPFAISVFLVQGLFWQGGPILYEIGPLSLKTEGVLFAIMSTGRIMVVVGAFLLLSYSTRPDTLMIALAQWGVPSTLTYIVLSSLQIVPRFRARADTILAAQQSRGLAVTGGLRARIRSIMPLVVPLILGSIIDVEQRAIALEARAFGRAGPKTSLLVLEDSQVQAAARRAMILLVLTLIGLRIYLLVSL